MAVFSCRGIDLDGRREGSGPPFLALHGANGPAGLDPCIGPLAERFEMLVPHHPGFGGTPAIPELDSIDDLAYLYLDLLGEMDLSGVTLLGFSMGGWIAAEMAVKSTARIARLILVDAVGIRVPGRDDCEIADIFNTHPAKLPDLVFHDRSYAVDPASLTKEQQVMMARAREAAARYTWEPYMHNPKLLGRLHRIDVPTLVIWGASDRLVPPGVGEAYRDAIPDARLTVIAEAGHAPQVEQTGRFIAEIVDFAAVEAVA